MKKRRTTDAVEILRRRLSHIPNLDAKVEEEHKRLMLAQKIWEAREAAGLTQEELASRIGTKQPVIARLESGEYRGITVNTLLKIASALKRQLNIDIVPVTQ